MRTASLLIGAAVLCVAAAPSALAITSGWAVVSASGFLERGKNATLAAHSGTGTYSVDFSHSLTNCSYTATIGDGAAGTPPPGYVTLAGAAGDPQGVFVTVFDRLGNPADIGFHLNVRC